MTVAKKKVVLRSEAAQATKQNSMGRMQNQL
jgi:hypothetical protein